MRVAAAVLGSIGHDHPFGGALEVADVDLAAPGPGEVLVRIAAAGVCHSDLSVITGDRPRPVPMVLGHEAAGVVEEVGADVSELAVGDHVVATFVPSCGACPTCAGGRPVLCPSAQRANAAAELVTGRRPFSRDGSPLHQHLGVSAFATHTVASPRSLVKIPDDVPPETAAVFGCAVLTGCGAVANTAGVAPGDTVAVFGLGGVGLAAVMGAVIAGAERVIGVDLVAAKLALAVELGATDVVDASDADPVAAVAELTGGGVDWAFETAGSARVLEQCYAATGVGGSTVSVGLPHPDDDFAVKAVTLVAQEKTVKGSYMGSAVPRRDIPRLLELHRQGRLPADKLISRRGLGLADLNEAMAELSTGGVVRQLVQP